MSTVTRSVYPAKATFPIPGIVYSTFYGSAGINNVAGKVRGLYIDSPSTDRHDRRGPGYRRGVMLFWGIFLQ